MTDILYALNVDAIVERISRRDERQEHVDRANLGVRALLTLCYERDTDGRLVNVDEQTHRILVPRPKCCACT